MLIGASGSPCPGVNRRLRARKPIAATTVESRATAEGSGTEEGALGFTLTSSMRKKVRAISPLNLKTVLLPVAVTLSNSKCCHRDEAILVWDSNVVPSKLAVRMLGVQEEMSGQVSTQNDMS